MQRHSIIIPTYNQTEDLNRALSSLVLQTYKEFEVIVIDDGSAVDNYDVIKSFEKNLNIRFCKIDNSGSPAKPRNIGIKMSYGNWISFLDSDDWWHPSRMEVISQTIANNDSDIYYHKLLLKKMVLGFPLVSIGSELGTNSINDFLTYGNSVPNSSLCIRKSCLENISLFAEKKPLIEDFDLNLRLLKNKYRYHFINKNLGFYWLGNNNISKTSKRNILGFINVYKKNNLIKPMILSRGQQSYYYYYIGTQFLILKHYKISNKYLIKANAQASPLKLMKYKIYFKLLFVKIQIFRCFLYENKNYYFNNLI